MTLQPHEIVRLSDEELLERHDEYAQILRHGDPDAVTTPQVRELRSIRIELINRIAHEVLEE